MTRIDYGSLLIGTAIIVISNIFIALPSPLPNQFSAFATPSGESEKIAFISSRDDSNWEIYVMNVDGSNITRLTNNRVFDVDPSWSPDGTKIAFRTERDGLGIPYNNAEIYVMNVDGSNPTRLTNNPYFDAEPSWSPDGTKIAFSTGRDGGMGEIYVMNADGSGQTRLTNTASAHEAAPDWSPDGTKIAFDSVRDGGNIEIYVMNADGSGQTRLTNNVGLDQFPSWSPDGTKIAFSSNDEIYVMNADGSNPTRLTNSRFADIQPSWSPDGTKIAFDSVRDGNDEIYLMNADGSGQTNISNNPALDGDPDWGSVRATEPSEDTSPPVLTVPDNKVVEAASEQGAEVTYTVTAQDNVDGNATLEEDGSITQDDIGGDIDISCEPASDTTFPIGNTTVECSATDEAGNEGTSPFVVTVNAAPPPPPADDTTPPVLTVPPDITKRATGPNGAQVSFEVSAEDNVDGNATLEEDSTTVIQDDVGGNITMSCDPPSGSVFPIGDTEVQCSATDEAGNTGTESFTVTVIPPSPSPPTSIPTAKQIIDRLISTIQNLDNDNVPQSVKTNLTAVLKQVSNILSDDNPDNDGSACDGFDTFIGRVNAVERRDDDNTLTADQADELRTQAEEIRDELLLGC